MGCCAVALTGLLDGVLQTQGRLEGFSVLSHLLSQKVKSTHLNTNDLKCALRLGVERVGVPLAESSYFATFTDSSCCVALSASVLELSANKIQKVTINFALFQQVLLFEC